MSDLGTLSSLGLGSKGALSYDTIDKLKKADESALVKPIDDKITLTKKKEDSLNTLTTLLASLKGSASALSYDDMYSKTTTDISGTSATATVADGVPSQTIDLNVSNIATNDIQESKSFNSQTSTFTSSADTLNFKLASGESFDINVDSNTTISSLEEQINNKSNGTISASILNVGGTDPYKLVIKSDKTGADNAITVSSTGGGTAADDLSLSEVGNGAQDANFTYNGISVTRSSNDISDLITGVTLKLQDSGSTTIKISKDNKSIIDGVNDFIKNYNNLIDNLNDSTKYNPDTKKTGVFQGVSQVRNIKNEINNIIFNLDSNNNSLSSFGITQNSTGHLELDDSTLKDKLNNNFNEVKDFFEGGTATHQSQGIFPKLNDKLGSIFMDSNSQLGLYKNYLEDRLKDLNTQKNHQTTFLDQKYDIMAKKFAAYDSMISNFNSASQSLQMQIASYTSTKQ